MKQEVTTQTSSEFVYCFIRDTTHI